MKPKPAHLEQIQRWMQSVIMHPGSVAEGVAADATRQHLDVPLVELESVVLPSRALDSQTRLEIYVDAYYERLLECLRSEFCGTQYAVGDELFDALAFGYLQQYPSRSYTLGNLGLHFATYLDDSRLHARDLPEGVPPGWPDFVVELAAFERVQREVFDAEGTEQGGLLNAEELARLAPEQWSALRLSVAPCLRLYRAAHPVHEFWQAFREEMTPAAPQPKPTRLAINRRHYHIERHPLSEAQYALLGGLTAGASLSEAIGAALSIGAPAGEMQTADLAEWFARWSRQGFFIALSPGDVPAR